jgi:hypothetical protein
MKKEILFAMIDKWNGFVPEPHPVDSTKDAELSRALEKGMRMGKQQCADDLIKLIALLE